MKQETLEEAAERLYSNDEFYDEIYCDIGKFSREKWIEGAKWQQEQDKNKYSQLDVVRILSKYETLNNEDFNKWFEQFKK